MNAPRQYRWRLGPALALLAWWIAPFQQVHAQVADAGRVEQLKVNIQAERLRVDAQPFEGAPRIRAEIEDLRDDVGFLLGALRRGQAVTDEECHALEVRLQGIRQELRQADAWPNGGPGRTSGSAEEVSLGAEVDVALTRPLSSRVAATEDRFEATSVADLQQQGHVLVPAGSLLSGLVTHVDRASMPDVRGSLTVVFDQITVHGSTYAIDTIVTGAVEADIRGESANMVLGSHNTVLATEGHDVELPVGSVLRVRFQSPLELTVR